MKKWIYFITIAVLLSFINMTYATDNADNNAEMQRGKAIYEKSCKTCHASPTAELMKAPLVHDEKAWQTRIDAADEAAKQDEKYETGLDYLVTQIRKGKNAMPPGGMCIDTTTSDKKCTDADYIAAIKFMSQKAK